MSSRSECRFKIGFRAFTVAAVMVGKEYAKEAGLDARKAHIICGMNHHTRERTLLKDGIRIGAAKNLRVNEQGLLVGDLYFDDAPARSFEVIVESGEMFQWVDEPQQRSRSLHEQNAE